MSLTLEVSWVSQGFLKDNTFPDQSVEENY